MKTYICIISKYDNLYDAVPDLKTSPTDMCHSIFKKICANSLKEAFESLVQIEEVTNLWNCCKTVHPYYLDDSGKCIYYHKEFQL